MVLQAMSGMMSAQGGDDEPVAKHSLPSLNVDHRRAARAWQRR